MIKEEISFCGRFEEIKGVITLIYAFKRILETVSKANVKLNLIGDGSLREKVFDLIKELDLEDNVNVYSNIAHQEVLKIFLQILLCGNTKYRGTICDCWIRGYVSKDCCYLYKCWRHVRNGLT